MPRHQSNSRYFADDKDLQDIFAQSRFTLQKLREYGASRGVYFSTSSTKDELVDGLCTIIHSWPEVASLVAQMDTSERPAKLVPMKKMGVFSNAEVQEVLEKVKEQRSFADETLVLKKTKDDEFTLEVHYSETHYEKTRLLQKEPKFAKIEIKRRGDRVDLRVEDNPRAVDIAKSIIACLGGDAGSDGAAIDLSEIADPKLRTLFFIELIRGIYAYELNDVTDLRVEYMVSASVELEDADADEVADPDVVSDEQKEELKAKLKSVAFSGSGLLFSKRYQEFVDSGFYVSKVTWTVDHDSKVGERVALSAEFSLPERGKGFRYAVLGKWERASDGDLKKTRVRLKPLESKKFAEAVEQAAFDAYDAVSARLTVATEEEASHA